jgi:hypothetical protein
MKSVAALALSTATLVLLWYLFWQPELPTARAPSPATADGDYPLRDWSAERREKLNISLFTFNDRNRNGRYDVGDSPQASIVVRVTRPDGSVVTARSNINGYANFGMLSGQAEADISQADADYYFAVSVPPQWQLSTANAEQVIHFSALPGSPSGLMTESPPAVVGLMPRLAITGRVIGIGGRQPQVSATAPDGERRAVVLGDDNTFSFEGEPGDWLLTATDIDSGVSRQRPFSVANAPVQLSAMDLVQPTLDPLVFPVVEDFEGLQRSVLEKLPGGRSGLGWDFLIAADNQFYGGPGYANGLRSGKMVGYNSSGHPVTITPDVGDERFDFVGAYFLAAWPSAHGEQLLVQAWRDGELVGQEEISLSYLGPVWFQADYHRIDRLTLSSAHYWQFVTEDMAFRVARAPEEGMPGQSVAN